MKRRMAAALYGPATTVGVLVLPVCGSGQELEPGAYFDATGDRRPQRVAS